MTFWNAENIRGVVAGSWVARPAEIAPIVGVSTDTRTLSSGQAFVALRGERFDGHTLLGQAQASGSPLAIVDDQGPLPPAPAGLAVIRVTDTKRALLALASAYREKLTRTTVIAVCGSNGKTTTVRLIDAALRGGGLAGSYSPKSFNNHIGVPLTILAARPEHQYLICEIGTNAKGEIAALARVARPDIAVITSIGREHLEKLSSVREVAREEATVLEFVKRGGAGVINADAPHLLEVLPTLESRPTTLIRFGQGASADVRVVGITSSEPAPRQVFTLNDKSSYAIPLAGVHNALNAAAAVAVARRLGIPAERIAAGLVDARPPEMRLEIAEIKGVRVINDAYNANPDSMRAALDTFPSLAAGAARRVLVLGDMLELGPRSAPEHRELGEYLASSTPADRVVLVGAAMAHAGEALSGGPLHVECLPDLEAGRAAHVASLLKPGDAVLLKGSRGMRLERIVQELKA